MPGAGIGLRQFKAVGESLVRLVTGRAGKTGVSRKAIVVKKALAQIGKVAIDLNGFDRTMVLGKGRLAGKTDRHCQGRSQPC